MKLGIHFGSSTYYPDVLGDLVAYERAGADVAWLGESYGLDVATTLGALAARTTTMQMGPAIVAVQTRSAALIAMTAAGLDALSGGRALLCLGSSGPQVIEGLHDVEFGRPLQRTRHVIRVCRSLWDGEAIVSDRAPKSGKYRPLKLMHRPATQIPIFVASVGGRNVEMTAELADGWMPAFFWPDRADAVWGDALRSGQALRSDALGPLEISVTAPLAVGADIDLARAVQIGTIAHYIGGMGTRETNFYMRLAGRYGYGDVAARIQDLYLDGDKAGARALVPPEFADGMALVGDEQTVAERIGAYRAAGVTVLNVSPAGEDLTARAAQVVRLRRLLDEGA